MKILTIFGTRPEAIKMAPLVKGFMANNAIESLLCVTGQHREMLDQVLDIFALTPDFDLNIMQPGQSLSQITSLVLLGLEPVIAKTKPDWVFVHGDTTTTVAASMAAYYQSIKLAHVEAGLRTYNISEPWPEEVNRRITSSITSCHFAPTEKAKQNLLAEQVREEDILVSGNTVIDALFSAQAKLESSDTLKQSIQENLPPIDLTKKLIVVTGHRRESFGEGLDNICKAILKLSERPDVQIIYPVHLNPHVKTHVEKHLKGHTNINLIEPLAYLSFVYLMSKAHIILTDSGGIQEEAPSFGIPVLVTRNRTERPEAIEMGTVKLVGHDTQRIIEQTTSLLDSERAYKAMSDARNPYGDGKAVNRIVNHILKAR